MDHDEERTRDATRTDISDAIRNASRDASVDKSSSGADSCEQRSDSEEEDDLFQIGRHAKKVSWGAPSISDSEDSFSSGGVHVYGRGAEKVKSKERKEKESKKKKHFKQSSNKSQVDIIEKDGFIVGAGAMFKPAQKGRGTAQGR